jgi:hypothetical protein
MYNFTAGGGQCSAYSGFESLATFLEQPRVHHPPAAYKPDAVVLPQVFGSSRNSMAFQAGRRGADNASGGQNFFCNHTRIRRQADAQVDIKPIIDNIQAESDKLR